MKNRKKHMIFFLLLLILSVTVFEKLLETPVGRMRTKHFAGHMGPGLNLGNTLDATGLRDYRPEADELEYETCWGNPKTDRKVFAAIADAGFGTVRIPVTWEDHMDEEGQISEKWMNRVREVADLALSEGLYVVLNLHHEEWLDLQTEREAEILVKFEIVWRQIAETFADYDGRLLFESMNEPRLRDSAYEWTSGTPEMRDLVNRLNERFVRTVRKTGKKNSTRYLLICPYASTSEEEGMRGLVVPDDDRIIVSIHMYKPYSFCQKEGEDREWDKPENRKRIAAAFSNMNEIFVEKGIPVILTEFGCVDKGNLEERTAWTKYYVEQAAKYHINYIWWDCGAYRLLDRESGEWLYPGIVERLLFCG